MTFSILLNTCVFTAHGNVHNAAIDIDKSDQSSHGSD